MSPFAPGRKSGKGCYVYSGRKGKNKNLNTDAESILERYKQPVLGRSAPHAATYGTHKLISLHMNTVLCEHCPCVLVTVVNGNLVECACKM